jgi:hypothetical protein
MPFLTLNGVTIPIKSNAIQRKFNEHRLDRDRMFDGTMRVIRGGQALKYGAGVYRQWDVNTASMNDADRDVLLAMVNGDTIPLIMSGDIVGGDTVAVIPVPGSDSPLQTATGFRNLNTFTLHETPAPLPADTTASIYLACLRGRGYWQNFAKTTPSGDGDIVEVWEDQSGNGRDLKVLTALGGVEMVPFRAGNTLHFGVSTSGVEGGPGDSRTFLAIPTDIPSAGNYAALGAAEMMIAFRLAAFPPGSDTLSGSWGLNSAGSAGSQFTTTTRHIFESAFLDGGASAGDQLDLGVCPVDPSAAIVVYSVGADGRTGHERYVVTLNGVTLYDDAFPIVPHGFWVNGVPGIGWVSASGDKYMVGYVQDFVMNAGVFTDSQRRSWYDYMRGATSDPPLP